MTWETVVSHKASVRKNKYILRRARPKVFCDSALRTGCMILEEILLVKDSALAGCPGMKSAEQEQRNCHSLHSSSQAQFNALMSLYKCPWDPLQFQGGGEGAGSLGSIELYKPKRGMIRKWHREKVRRLGELKTRSGKV